MINAMHLCQSHKEVRNLELEEDVISVFYWHIAMFCKLLWKTVDYYHSDDKNWQETIF